MASSNNDELEAQLEQELSELIGRYVGRLPEDAIADALDGASRRLRRSSSGGPPVPASPDESEAAMRSGSSTTEAADTPEEETSEAAGVERTSSPTVGEARTDTEAPGSPSLETLRHDVEGMGGDGDGSAFDADPETHGMSPDALAEASEAKGENDADVERTATWRDQSGTERLELTYETPEGLEAETSRFIDARVLLLELDTSPPMLAPLETVLSCRGHDDELELSGRAVRETEEGVAFQLDETESELEAKLQSFVEMLSETAEEEGAEEASETSASDEEDTSGRSRRSSGVTTGVSSTVGSTETTSSQGDDGSDATIPDLEPNVEERLGPVSSATMATPSAEETTNSLERHRTQPVQASSETWTLQETDILSILGEVARKPDGGRLIVDTGERRATLYLRGGQLFEIETEPERTKERLEHLLLKSGHLDKKDLREAERHAEKRDLRIEEALRDLQTLPYRNLMFAIKSRVSLLLRKLFDVSSGEATYQSLEALPDHYFHPPVSLHKQVFEEIVDRMSEKPRRELLKHRETFVEKRIVRTDASRFPFDVLELDSREQRLLDGLLDEPIEFDEILRSSRLNTTRVVSLLMAFKEVGAVDIHGFDRETRTRERKWERLKLLYDQVTSDNLFDALGLHWTTYGEEVEETCEELRANISRFEEMEQLDAEGEEKLERISERIEEACQTLSSHTERRRYRQQVVEEFQRKSARQMYEKQLNTLTLRDAPDEIADRCKRILDMQPGHDNAKQILRRSQEIQREKEEKRKNMEESSL